MSQASSPTSPANATGAAVQSRLWAAVRSTLSTRRIGTPVFVRLTVQGQASRQQVLEKLAAAAALVQDWVGEPVRSLYAVEAADTGQLAVTLQFAGGQTAILGHARGPVLGNGIDLMILGNRGAIYHDFLAGEPWEAEAAFPPPSGMITPARLERAIQAGQPVRLAAEGGVP